MYALGSISLLIALLLSGAAVFIPAISLYTGKNYLKESYLIAYANATLLTLSTVILAVALLTSDFRLVYVQDYTNRALGWVYKLSAVYAGQAGSLLFWGWLIAIFAAIVAYTKRDDHSDSMAYVMSILSGVVWFFVFLISLAPLMAEMSSNAKQVVNIASILLMAVAVIGVAAAYYRVEDKKSFAKHAYIGLAAVTLFFLVRLAALNTSVVGTNPFELAKKVVADGAGLNPLLQNYGMIFHPPTLFLGFAGFTVPFAFAIAALITSRYDNSWVKETRLWTVFSWLLLTVGIVLGAQWAYMELGWGGYWAWDPVENASLIPWLTGTALMHSMLFQRRRSFFKNWNLFLVVATFILCIYGTYLTRSGVVSSVHSFGESPIGNFILAFIVLVLAGSLVLVFSRFKVMTSDKHIVDYLSKDFMFLLTNVFFVIAAVVVFYGTDYPLIVKAIQWVFKMLNLALPANLQGAKEVGKGFYELLMGPLTVVFFTVMALCGVISWKKFSLSKAPKTSRYLIIGTSGVVSILGIDLVLLVIGLLAKRYFNAAALYDMAYGWGKLLLTYSGILILIVMGGLSIAEIYKTVRSKAGINWNRAGIFTVHLGVALAFIGIIISSVYAVSKQATLKVGESQAIAGYTFKYEGINQKADDLKESNQATVSLWKGSNQLSALVTSIDSYYSATGEPKTVTEPGLYFNLKEDVYTALTSFDGQTASFKFLYNPMIIWFWIGSGVIALGGLALLFARFLPRGKLAASAAEEKLEEVPVSTRQAVVSCGKCGRTYNKGESFCVNCGAKLDSVDLCQCGAPRQKGAKFCTNCGRRL